MGARGWPLVVSEGIAGHTPDLSLEQMRAEPLCCLAQTGTQAGYPGIYTSARDKSG